MIATATPEAVPGPALGFSGAPREMQINELPLRGRLPEWLSGRLLRTAPAAYENGAWRAEHWFDGLCFLYGFRFAGGRVAFRSRFLESEEYRAARAGEARFAGAFRLPQRSVMERLREPLPPTTDNTNISVASIGGRVTALGESMVQNDIDPETLHCLGPHRYADNLPEKLALIAHPVADPARRSLVSLGIQYGGRTVLIYELADGENRRVPLASWRTMHLPYVHSFAATARHAVIVDHPFRAFLPQMGVNLALGLGAFFDCFEWQQKTPTRLVVFERDGGRSWTVETDPLFLFHVVNAWDAADGGILIDLMAIEEKPDLAELRFDRLRQAGPSQWPVLRRLYLREGRPVRSESERAVRFDFPATDPRRSTQRHRFVWGTGIDPAVPRLFASTLYKVDTETAHVRRFARPALYFNEPIIVPRPAGTREDDGVLLTVVLDAAAGRSALLVLDAASLQEIALAELPVHLPFGFHGRFFAA
jgi:carotenoid cleavage dioxygenase-like enzyme